MTHQLSKTGLATLGAGIVAALVSVVPTAAQQLTDASACPCMTAASIDSAYNELGFSPNQAGTKWICAEEESFATLQQSETRVVERVITEQVLATAIDAGPLILVEPRTITERSILANLERANAVSKAQCTFEVVSARAKVKNISRAITNAQAAACLEELKASKVYAGLCPAK